MTNRGCFTGGHRVRCPLVSQRNTTREGDTMKREIVILVKAKDKTEEIWVDGKLKYKHTYNYAEHAIKSGQASAEQFAHHDPVLRIDISGI